MTLKPNLSFTDYLDTNLKLSPPRQKGERTRGRLKLATARMLELHGYHGLRVIDITKTAGVSEGAFYVYFEDKKDASLATLSSFLTEFVDTVAPPENVHVSFDSIREANLRWFEFCRANAGLLRCVFQLGDQEKEFARLVQSATKAWYVKIARNVTRDLSETDEKVVLLITYFMGSMMDEIVRKLIVFPDHEFHTMLKSISADDATVADAASLIWTRVFSSTIEIPSDLSAVTKSLASMLHLNGA